MGGFKGAIPHQCGRHHAFPIRVFDLSGKPQFVDVAPGKTANEG
jgi:hypothetical protein